MNNPMRVAFTLTEVMISIAIMVVVMSGILSSMTAVMDYTSLGKAQDDLVVTGRAIARQIELDIGVSGWWDPTGKGYQATSAAERSEALARYYPYVQVQDYDSTTSVSGLGSRFVLHARRPSLVQLPFWSVPISLTSMEHKYDALPGSRADTTKVFWDGLNPSSYATQMADFYSSYFARSQEIIFLRSNLGSVGRNDYVMLFPKDNADAWRLPVDGTTVSGVTPQKALGILTMTEFQRAAFERAGSTVTDTYGSFTDPVTNMVNYYRKKGSRDQYKIFDLELPTAWLDWNNGEFSVNFRWETIEPIDSSTTTNPSGIASADVAYTNVDRTNGVKPVAHILSEYSYVVVPSTIGVGRLVRCVKTKLASASAVAPRTGTNPGEAISSGVDLDEPGSPTTYYLVVDKILSDDVARITFDTIRTQPIPAATDTATYGADGAAWIQKEALDVNQVRYRIYLVKEYRVNNQNTLIYRQIEGVTSMRARSRASDVDADRTAHLNVLPSPLQR